MLSHKCNRRHRSATITDFATAAAAAVAAVLFVALAIVQLMPAPRAVPTVAGPAHSGAVVVAPVAVNQGEQLVQLTTSQEREAAAHR